MSRFYRASLFATASVLVGLALLVGTITLAAAAPGKPDEAMTPAGPASSAVVRLSGGPGLALQPRGNPAPAALASILYVFRLDTATAGEFKGLLEAAGFGVTVAAIADVPSLVAGDFDLIMIADDTGSLNQWGAAPADAGVISQLTGANKPIIGLGEGGYAFFGKAGSPTGWPNGWHGPQTGVYASELSAYYTAPNDLSGFVPGTFPLYLTPVNEVGIYIASAPTVFPIGWEPRLDQKGAPGPGDHASLTLDGCYHLWGFSGGPSAMNANGKNLLVNAATYMSTFQCPPPPPPPADCVTLVKTDNPPSGNAVNPGDAIQYTLSYTVTDKAQCSTLRSVLLDQVPNNTVFVPGSATDGQAPNFDGTLAWDLGPLAQGAHGSKVFSASVLDTVCNGPQFITNTAQLRTNLGTFDSNSTSHKVNCPVVTLPNEDPPYAEREIEVYPYPLVTGAPTQLSVGIRNMGAASQTVTVTFQTSPDRFGIGLAFNALPVPGNPRVVTIGPHGNVEVKVDWTPVSSGHYCIQVKIEGAGFAPIYTQRNLDVTEDLQPGVQDILTFKVGNPTTAVADIALVVANTCPGWTAWVSPTVLTAVGANDSDIRDAELHVIPPNPAVLGTGCHIDVQGWIGAQLLGGIRKLDVPPVHLPPSSVPWLEQEISTIPTVPISGTVNQVCVELQNPLGVTRVVTVTFSEAAFGAGIGITPFATQAFSLPANSFAKYCVNWTPLVATSLHRCLFVALSQAGFQDQRSQRNLDIARLSPVMAPVSLSVPIAIGNPLPFTSTITLDGSLVGLSGWRPEFTPGPSLVLGPGGTQQITVRLVPAVMAQTVGAAAAGSSTFGDAVRLDVTVSLNGEPYGGFSLELGPPLEILLPLVGRNN